MTGGLTDLPPYIYGTTRLGDAALPRKQRLTMARSVLEDGLWVHTSDQYGEALEVLGEAIAPLTGPPSTIVKLGGGTAADIHATIRANTRPLGVERAHAALQHDRDDRYREHRPAHRRGPRPLARCPCSTTQWPVHTAFHFPDGETNGGLTPCDR